MLERKKDSYSDFYLNILVSDSDSGTTYIPIRNTHAILRIAFKKEKKLQ